MEDYINIDINNAYGPDLLWDLNNGIPFNDGVISEIIATHVLEHLDPIAIHNFVKELYRVCCGNAIIKIIVPIGKNWQKWPEHRIPFDEGSEDFFTIFFTNKKPMFNIKNKEVIRTEDGSGDELRLDLEVLRY